VATPGIAARHPAPSARRRPSRSRKISPGSGGGDSLGGSLGGGGLGARSVMPNPGQVLGAGAGAGRRKDEDSLSFEEDPGVKVSRRTSRTPSRHGAGERTDR
jgi:hypothetical protein